MHRSSRVCVVLATVLAVAVVAPIWPPDAVAAHRRAVRTIRHRVAPGLGFMRIVDRRTPRRIFVLRADIAKFPITYDITLAGRALGSRATVPQMAMANGAIAAINGDFSSRIVGRPIHAFVEDGRFVQSAGPGAFSFAVTHDERHAAVGPTRQVMTFVDAHTGITRRIDRWNHGPPGVGEIAAFSPAGGSLETPPAGVCAIHLAPDGPPSPSSGRPGFDQSFSIDASACSADPMAVDGGVVLTAVPGTDEATELTSLPLRTDVAIHLGLGWSHAYDVLGGEPMLVHRGRVAVPASCTSSFCHPQPRTGIGVRADGSLLLVVVDGRRRHYSLGMSILGFARLMRRLGAVEALNLDGGGASTMVVRGRVVNRPSDGHLRHVASAGLILPGPDPGEP
jgi:Phosphodiester glycosidase